MKTMQLETYQSEFMKYRLSYRQYQHAATWRNPPDGDTIQKLETVQRGDWFCPTKAGKAGKSEWFIERDNLWVDFDKEM